MGRLTMEISSPEGRKYSPLPASQSHLPGGYVLFGKIDPQNCGDLFRVFNTHFTGAWCALAANPDNLEDPGTFTSQGLYLELHSHLEGNASFQFRAKLADGDDLCVLGKRTLIGQHARNSYRASDVNPLAAA